MDPHEMNNIYGDEKYGDLRKEMETELASLRLELEVPSNDPQLE